MMCVCVCVCVCVLQIVLYREEEVLECEYCPANGLPYGGYGKQS